MLEFRRFLVKILLIFSPLIVLVAALEALAWTVGETMPMWMIADWQSNAEGRIWRGGDGRSYLTYKVARVRKLKPDIVMLGSSRANSFTQSAFAPYSFYNAGLTAWTFEHYRRFLELGTSEGYAPKVLFFNLDYWMFSAGFERHWVERFYEAPEPHVASLKMVFKLLKRRAAREALFRSLSNTDRAHGLYAVLNGDGFVADGPLVGRPRDADPLRLLNDGITVGVPPVELGDAMAADQIAQFERFAQFAREKGIALVGIQLPCYAKVVENLENNPQAGIWREFSSASRKRYFEKHGVIFFDFFDLPEYRRKPEYFVDSLHPDVRIVQGLLKTVLADPRVISVLPRTSPALAR